MKKIKIIIYSLLFIGVLPIKSFAQGIRFENGLSWQQLLVKAKNENKYIFIDCYATWCVPCKQMDNEVYPDSALGKFINSLFISAKMQMDTTKTDGDEVKARYRDAHQFMSDYRISAFPSLLFFSPEGKLIRRSVGSMSLLDFLRFALNSRDPDQQEYSLLDKFKSGGLPDSKIPGLIKSLGNSGDSQSADSIAQDYIQNYLLKLPNELLYRKDNIRLIAQYMKTSKDKAFDIFYQHSNEADGVAGKDFSDLVVLRIIRKENVYPNLWLDDKHSQRLTDKPDWTAIRDSIKNKYNKYDSIFLDRVLIDPKVAWYKQTKEWNGLIDAEMELIETFAIDSAGNITPSWIVTVNNILYDHVFLHSTDRKILTKAMSWEKMIVSRESSDPDYLDTYAALLYKIRNKRQALEIENTAIALKQKELSVKLSLMPVNDQRIADVRQELAELQNTLNKMKANKPTWQNNN